jgi:uncharacterized LabA/DUF88 family protein
MEKDTEEKKINSKPNLVFVDGQNLHLGTTKCFDCSKQLAIDLGKIKLSECTCGYAWEVNLSKLKTYLKDNYDVSDAYYFIGYFRESNNDIYEEIQKAGFLTVFKEHNELFVSSKKGNVDTDMVFDIMRRVADEGDKFDKIIIISGDGDYKKLVTYLISKNRFKKILFPNSKFPSSLYNELGSEYFDCLENIKSHIKK